MMQPVENNKAGVNILNMEHRASLRKYNLVAAIIHGAMAVLILITKFTIDAPFEMHFRKYYPNQPNYPPEYFNSTCNGRKYESTEAFAWLACVAENRNASEREAVITNIEIHDLGSIQVWGLIFAFELITCFVHLSFLRYDQEYFYYLSYELNPTRWREYSITNTLMLMALLALNGIDDVYLIISFITLTFALNYVGGLVFAMLTYLLEHEEIYTQSIRKIIIEMRRVLLVWSFVAYFIPIIAFWDIFTVTYNNFLAISEDTRGLFEYFWVFIFILNVVITILYNIFPLIHSVENNYLFFGIQIYSSYTTIEKAYLIASLLAKTSLTLIVFAACVQRA